MTTTKNLADLLGALAIIVGWRTRLFAFPLGGFTLLSAVIFHRALGDHMQSILFLKNLAIAGGFLFLLAHGAGAWSLDERRVASREARS
jgi:putative oxidoreductase